MNAEFEPVELLGWFPREHRLMARCYIDFLRSDRPELMGGPLSVDTLDGVVEILWPKLVDGTPGFPVSKRKR